MTISVANQKGGVGKTTTAVNLSACLAKRDKRVLVIDLDPQGNTTSGLGINKSQVRYSSYDLLIGRVSPEAAIQETAVPGLSAIACNMDLAGAEIELVEQPDRETVLKRAIEPIVHFYDYIFIDCPPSLGLLTLNALTASSSVLVPIQCEFFALEGLSQLMNTIKLVKRRLNPDLEIEGVVPTMFSRQTNLSAQVIEEVRKYFKSKVYDTTIPRNVRLAEAPSHGMPVILYDPACSGAQAYLALADEFLSRNEKGAKV